MKIPAEDQADKLKELSDNRQFNSTGNSTICHSLLLQKTKCQSAGPILDSNKILDF